MKKACVVFLLVAIMASSAAVASACTGFAVYGEKVMYGLNFDFPEADIVVRISAPEGYNECFTMRFSYGNLYGDNGLMNKEGLFTSTQNLYPEERYTFDEEEGTVSVARAAMEIPYSFGNVPDILKLLEEAELRHVYGSYHDLFADAEGNAFVLELIGGETIVTEIGDNPYILMTNFPVADLARKDFADIQGYGKDRYETAQRMIEEGLETFDVEAAFDVLEQTMQRSGSYPTQYSNVYDPANRTVYIAVKRDYDHIWQVTLDDKTLRTYSGFSAPVEHILDDDGINLKELIEYAQKDSEGSH